MLRLEGFTAPANEWDGLNRLSNNMEQKQQREMQMQFRQDEMTQRKEGRRQASLKFLNDYLDPKENLTGSPYDPQVVKGFNDLLGHGMKLASEGADSATIQMALMPSVGKLNEYSQKAKLIQEQKKKSLELLKGQKGIDLQKFSDEFDNTAWYEKDEQGNKKLRDFSQIDPQQMYGDQVLKDGDVYTKDGLDEFVQKSGKDARISNIYKYNKMGGRVHTKAKIVAPSFMTSDEDERGVHKEFVPAYDVAMDDGEPMTHEFTDKDGKKTKAPVRMVKGEVFDQLPTSYKGYLRNEVKKYAQQHGKELSSKEAENLAKTFAYDDLKEHSRSSSTIEELYDNKPSAQEIRFNITGNAYAPKGGSGSGRGSGANGEVTINDTYGSIEERLKGSKQEGHTHFAVSALTNDEQDAVLTSISKVPGADLSNVYLSTETGNGLKLYAAKDIKHPSTDEVVFKKGDLVKTFTSKGMNIKTQVGAKEKRAVVAEGNPAPKEQPKTLTLAERMRQNKK